MNNFLKNAKSISLKPVPKEHLNTLKCTLVKEMILYTCNQESVVRDAES